MVILSWSTAYTALMVFWLQPLYTEHAHARDAYVAACCHFNAIRIAKSICGDTNLLQYDNGPAPTDCTTDPPVNVSIAIFFVSGIYGFILLLLLGGLFCDHPDSDCHIELATAPRVRTDTEKTIV